MSIHCPDIRAHRQPYKPQDGLSSNIQKRAAEAAPSDQIIWHFGLFWSRVQRAPQIANNALGGGIGPVKLISTVLKEGEL
jgi:hypothetical protein